MGGHLSCLPCLRAVAPPAVAPPLVRYISHRRDERFTVYPWHEDVWVCNFCRAEWHIVNVGGEFAQDATHYGGQEEYFPAGQAGMCLECQAFWQEH